MCWDGGVGDGEWEGGVFRERTKNPKCWRESQEPKDSMLRKDVERREGKADLQFHPAWRWSVILYTRARDSGK